MAKLQIFRTHLPHYPGINQLSTIAYQAVRERILSLLCFLFFLLASPDLMAAQANTTMDFCVVAPATKSDGKPWDADSTWGLPDIFVCLRATQKRWDCAEACVNSQICSRQLNRVPLVSPLKITVFDKDIQENDPIYVLEIKDVTRCNSGDGDSCKFARDGKLLARFGQFPCNSCLAEPRVSNWYTSFETCKRDNPSDAICDKLRMEGRGAYLEMSDLDAEEVYRLPLECRVGYLERLAHYLGTSPFPLGPSHSAVMSEIERLYRSNRGIYKDPNLLSETSKNVYREIAEALRDFWDRQNLWADELPRVSMNLTPENLRVIPDLFLENLNKHEKQAVKGFEGTTSRVYVSENVDDPRNAYFCARCIDGEEKEGGKYEIVVVKPNFRKLGLIEQAFALLEEAYHAHQHDMTEIYLNKVIAVSNPRHDVYKLYTINFVFPAITVANSGPYESSNKVESGELREKRDPNFYLQEGDYIYGAYYNQPHDYNAKYVAGYIIGRALCYKNQKRDPIEGIATFSDDTFRSGFHEHFHCE